MKLPEESTRTRNPEGTRKAVIDAAQRLFAEKGFAGTSLRDIAHESGVSQPLIQHHFGSKDQLYSAVIHRSIQDFVGRFPEDDWATDRPVDLRTEMTRMFQFFRENEEQLRMVRWSRLEGRCSLLKGCVDLRGAMVRRIEQGQRLGLVRDDIDAASLGVMLEGILVYWFENREMNAELFPEPPSDDAFLENAIALLQRGFAPEAPAT